MTARRPLFLDFDRAQHQHRPLAGLSRRDRIGTVGGETMSP
jgi:hypothetical protein